MVLEGPSFAYYLSDHFPLASKGRCWYSERTIIQRNGGRQHTVMYGRASYMIGSPRHQGLLNSRVSRRRRHCGLTICMEAEGSLALHVAAAWVGECMDRPIRGRYRICGTYSAGCPAVGVTMLNQYVRRARILRRHCRRYPAAARNACHCTSYSRRVPAVLHCLSCVWLRVTGRAHSLTGLMRRGFQKRLARK
jgi:hypothetical protein